MRLDLHVANWSACERCPLGYTARRHVLYDLVGPFLERADIMFVGEGPGASEDTLGKPFIGPTGRLLRKGVAAADAEGLTVLYANLVACRPTEEGRRKDRPPTEEEVAACAPRLKELQELFQPRVVVALGRVPQQHLPEMLSSGLDMYYELPHPSAIARSGGEESLQWPGYVSRLKAALTAARQSCTSL